MASKALEYYNIIVDNLNDKTKPWDPFLTMLEKKTNVKRLYLFFGTVAFLALYLLIGYGAQIVCNTICFMYPAYASIKAIESPQKNDDTKWLTYWTTFAFFSIVEYPSDLLLYWIPFYWLIKCVFMICLFAPMENNGSIILYHKAIRPLFLKHTSQMDQFVDKVAHTASDIVGDVKNVLKKD